MSKTFKTLIAGTGVVFTVHAADFVEACERASYPMDNRCGDVEGAQEIFTVISSTAAASSPVEAAMTVRNTIGGDDFEIVLPVYDLYEDRNY